MLIMMFAAIVSIFEISIVWNVKPIYRLITETKYGGLIGVGLSVLLSMFMASVFGAAGMVVMGGAMLGTLTTAVVYYFRLIEIAISLWEATRSFINATKEFISSIRDTTKRTLMRVRRFSYAFMHPVVVARNGNPHPVV